MASTQNATAPTKTGNGQQAAQRITKSVVDRAEQSPNFPECNLE